MSDESERNPALRPALLALLLLAPSLAALPIAEAHRPIRDPIEFEERVLVDVNDDMALFPELVDLVALDVGEVFIIFAGGSYVYFKAVVRYTWNETLPQTQAVNVSFEVKGERFNLTLLTSDGAEWIAGPYFAAAFEYESDPREREIFVFVPFGAMNVTDGDVLSNFTMQSMALVNGNFTDADRAPEGTHVAGSPLDAPVGAPEGGPELDDLARRLAEDPTLGWEPSRENLTQLDPLSGGAFRVGEHPVKDGRDRFTAVVEPDTVWMEFGDTANFTITVTSATRDFSQRLLIFGRVPNGARWQALLTGEEVRTLGPGESTTFSVALRPLPFDPAPTLDLRLGLISDLGGFQVVTLKARILGLATPTDLLEGHRFPRVEFLNANDRFRVNETRPLLFHVTDQNGLPFSGLLELQVLVHPLGEEEKGVNYALETKPNFDGMYQLPRFFFAGPGTWVMNLTIFDDPARPYFLFTVQVDERPQPPHIVPPWLVLGFVVVGLLLIAFKNRLRLILQRRTWSGA